MSAGQPTRRRNHVDMPVAYAAVGASRAPDLLRFPPSGSTPYEEELRLGSGQERFLAASSLLMTWGAQRGSGIAVRETQRGTEEGYVGPQFDGGGAPQAAAAPEEFFGPEGDPYVVPGTSAVLSIPGQDEREVLVVYTIVEARSVGFAWGTSDERGVIGEQLFAVELRDDETVWAIARGFIEAPKSGLLGLRAKADLKSAIDSVRQQLAALLPGARQATGTAAAEHPEAATAEAVEIAEAPEGAEAPEAAESPEAPAAPETPADGASPAAEAPRE